jgi:DNA-binding NtrC family response regulator
MAHSGECILIIDTRDEWLSFAKAVLTEAGYKVEIARSVREAEGISGDDDNRFDLILADQKVVEAESNALRDLIWIGPDRRRRVVVVFPTQLTLDKMRPVFKLGVFDCVDKQYERDKLVDLVQKVFERPFSARPRGRRRPVAVPSFC